MKIYNSDYVMKDDSCFIKKYPLTIQSEKPHGDCAKVAKFSSPSWKLDANRRISTVTPPFLGMRTCIQGVPSQCNYRAQLFNTNKSLDIVKKILGMQMLSDSREPKEILCHQDLIGKMMCNYQWWERFRLLKFNYQEI